MNLDFIPRDYLVFLHPVEPIADVGILTVAGLNTVRITDQRQQVSIAVIGKETFDILLVQFPVHILSRVRQPREAVVGEDISVLRAVAGRVSLVLPLPRGDISRIGVSERHVEQLAAFLGQPASDVVFRLFSDRRRPLAQTPRSKPSQLVVLVVDNSLLAAVYLCRLV